MLSPSRNRSLVFTLCLGILTACAGCTKSDSDSGGGDSGGDSGGGSGGGSLSGGGVQCGVVSNGKVTYPEGDDGEFVQVVSVLGSNLVVIAEPETGENRRLVKLQGVGASSTDFKRSEAIRLIENNTNFGAYFFKATKDCDVVLSSGGRGTIGSLVTTNGKSIAEELISQDWAPADLSDACSGSLLAECLSNLESTKESQVFGPLEPGFLWKPVSDKNGNLVVHVYECDVRLFVNGQELQDTGSGNGRCSTFRGSRPGCAYGQAVVKVIDKQTELPLTYQGKPQINIPNGCERFEIEG